MNAYPIDPYFDTDIALVQGKQTALRSALVSINRKNQDKFLEISSVFSGSARYFKTECLTSFHDQRQLKKYADNTCTFHTLRSNRRSTKKQAKALNPYSSETERQ